MLLWRVRCGMLGVLCVSIPGIVSTIKILKNDRRGLNFHSTGMGCVLERAERRGFTTRFRALHVYRHWGPLPEAALRGIVPWQLVE